MRFDLRPPVSIAAPGMEDIDGLESGFLDRCGEDVERSLCARCEVNGECHRKEMALCAYFDRPVEAAGLGYREFLERQTWAEARKPCRKTLDGET